MFYVKQKESTLVSIEALKSSLTQQDFMSISGVVSDYGSDDGF